MVPEVSIITVNYNQPELTYQLLDSIYSGDFLDVEVIVVDNGSKNNPEKYLVEAFPDIVFIRSSENLGFAGGNNLGVAKSKGNFLFFVNNDTILPENTLATLLNLFSTIPNLGMVSPMIYFDRNMHKNKEELIQYAGSTRLNPVTGRNKMIGRLELDKGQFQRPEPTYYVHGAAMMVPRKIIDKVGLMREDYFLYYEELDWCERIRKAGFKIYIEPRAKIFHAESTSTGHDSPLKTYFLNRNRILFMRRHHKGLNLIGFFGFLIFFSVPKNLGYFLIQKKWKHFQSYLNAVLWHIKH